MVARSLVLIVAENSNTEKMKTCSGECVGFDFESFWACKFLNESKLRNIWMNEYDISYRLNCSMQEI